MCEVHAEYSRICHIPDTVDPGWLNAAITALIIFGETPIEYVSQYYMAVQEAERERDGAKKEKAQQWIENSKKGFVQSHARLRKMMADLRQRFPNHVWENPMHTIKLDPNRPDVDGAGCAWPVDGSALNEAEYNNLVGYFVDSILNAYNAKPKGEVAADQMHQIIKTLANRAAARGYEGVHEKVMESFDIRDFMDAKAEEACPPH